ncbi:ABC transporter substrate-binding protein [Nisaea sp.]|uniref:ABC transporter substrate-binding protein n=2 Tax=Pseudomonadota TaxID=1224 RepID=UPI0032664F04
MKMLKMLAVGAVVATAMTSATTASADCGKVSITEMNWASSQIITEVSKFLLEQGYGCTVEKVPSATTTAVASLAENGEPDIVTELWLNSTGDAYAKMASQGKVEALADVLAPGGVEGWWIPQYLADKHPELLTMKGVLANPKLVGAQFNNCPDGWGCRIVNDNLIKALDLPGNGIEVFNHGSGETLATSIAAAYEDKKPWFGYYWGPTAVLGQYKMAKVEIGAINQEIHTGNQNKDNANPGVSDFPPAPVLTVVTANFKKREPAVAELMSKVSFDVNVMNEVLAWKKAKGASAEEAAVRFLSTQSDVWSKWVSDDARTKLSALIK